MTISSTINRVQYTGNAVTTTFAFPYVFFATTDLVVTLFNTTTQVAVTPAPVLNGAGTYDYTVSGTFDSTTGEYLSGANVIFNNAPLANHLITITRVVPQTQGVALIDNTKFPAATVNGALDRLTVLVQYLQQQVTRALQLPSSDPDGTNVTLPPLATRQNGGAGSILGFDASGNPFATILTSSITAVSTFIATNFLPAANAAAARTAIGAPSTSVFASVNVQKFTSPPTTITVTIASPAVLSWTAHGLPIGGAFQVTTTGALPTGMSVSTTYYVITTGFGVNSFQFSATPGGTAVITTGSQSGTHTGRPFYVPNAKTLSAQIEAWGAGASGGGGIGVASNGVGSGGGGAGSYSRATVPLATIGAGQLVTVGLGGAAPSAGFNNGNAGTDTSIGALCVGKGGSGGGASQSGTVGAPGLGGVAGTGDITGTGQPGGAGFFSTGGSVPSGCGGSSTPVGAGGPSALSGTHINGTAASGFASGGSGAASFNDGTSVAGGAGTNGYAVITEYLSP